MVYTQRLPACWRSNAGGLATTCQSLLTAHHDTQSAPKGARLHVQQSSISNQLLLQQQLLQSMLTGSSQLRQHHCKHHMPECLNVGCSTITSTLFCRLAQTQ